MKIPRLQKDSDELCQKSMNYLTARVEAWFLKGFNTTNVWCPDDLSSWSGINSKKLDQKKELEVVLYGNFIRDLLESQYWPGKSFRVWTLSNASRDCILELSSLSEDQVSVIPRSALLDPPRVINKGLSAHYVSAGRLSRQKNIDFTLLTFFFLQVNKEIDSSLTCYGDFDESYDYGFGRFKNEISYEEQLNKIIENLKWNSKPSFVHGLSETEWTEKFNQNSTFVSSSKFFMEDFGVAVAQIENKGLPQILSDWGGHKDVTSETTRFISSYLYPYDHFPMGIKIALAEIVSEKILKKNFHHKENTKRPLVVPNLIDENNLNKCRASLKKEFGLGALNILQDNLACFTDTKKGVKSYQSLRKLFSSDIKNTHNILFIVDTLGIEDLAESKALYFKTKELVIGDNHQISVIDSNMLLNSIDAASILSSEEIYYTQKAGKNPSVIKFLSNLGVSQELSVEADLPSGLAKIL